VATEPNLRHLFNAPQPASVIDVASVVRRSRARRVPKVLGITGVSVLAIGGLVFGGVQVLGYSPVTASDTAGSGLAEDSSAADSPMMSEAGGYFTYGDDSKRAAAASLNLCSAPLAEVAPSATGLVLSVRFADSPAGSAVVDGTVRMTNTGTQTLTGYTAGAPTITLSRDSVVLWHSNGPTTEVAREVSLAPGASIEYAASFTPVVCGVEDDSRESFRTDLPAASPGQYEVSAAIDFMGEFDAELVTSPASTISLT
jgi:hypothetical protein